MNSYLHKYILNAAGTSQGVLAPGFFEKMLDSE